jgi:hypothetical protein
MFSRNTSIAVLASALTMAVAIPAAAQASTYVYWPPGGSDTSAAFLYAGREELGPRHSLTKNSARSVGAGGATVCIETYVDATGQPIQNRCSSTLAYRDDLCGCRLYVPAVRAPGSGGGVLARAREDW